MNELIKKYKPLSAVMAGVLADIIDRGGVVVRHQGGYWTYPGAVPHGRHRWDWYCGTTTIEALVARGELTYTEWRDGRRGRFPIKASIAAGDDNEFMGHPVSYQL
jgi:hypothetical protein